MQLEKAQALKIGAIVRCPADRGEPAYRGKVESVGAHVTEKPVPFVWVSVRTPNGHAVVWPSNRLG